MILGTSNLSSTASWVFSPFPVTLITIDSSVGIFTETAGGVTVAVTKKTY